MTATREGIAGGLILAGLTVLACRSERPAATPAGEAATGSAPATAAADSARPAAAQRTRQVTGFSHPESVRYDPELDLWFVSNINGDPRAKDNNGFISRLKADGSIDVLQFVAGGHDGVRLNGPKGMAIVGDTLWVADIDAVRGFNRRTGAGIGSVSLAGKAKFLNDITAGPDGIYITDTGIEPGKADFKHSGPDRIFRIDSHRKASLALETDSLKGPNGITWDSTAHHFVIVPFFGATPLAWAPGEKAPRPLATAPGQEDGVEEIAPGRMLITSWADSSLFSLADGQVTRVAAPVPSPADIGWNPVQHEVAVPLLMEDRVEFWKVP